MSTVTIKSNTSDSKVYIGDEMDYFSFVGLAQIRKFEGGLTSDRQGAAVRLIH